MPFFSESEIETFSNSTVRVDFLVKMEFKSETIYVWNGEYELNIDGNKYYPMHGIGRIEGLGQVTTQQSQAITLTLDGIPDQDTNILSLALKETPEANQQLLTVYIQFFDEDWQPVASPISIWWGFMQPPKVSRTEATIETGSMQTISINAENAFFNRSRPPYGRYTDRDQQQRFEGDFFFRFIPSLINKTVTYPDF